MVKAKFLELPSTLLVTGVPEPEDWQAMSRKLLSDYRSIYWRIGDFVRLGEAQIGDEIYQYLEGFSPDLLDRCAAVANAFPIDQREESLSFSHHAVAMQVKPDVRHAVLSMAVMNGWGVGETTKYVKELRNG